MTRRSLAWWLWSTLAAGVVAGTGPQASAQQLLTDTSRVRAVDESRAADWPAGPWQAVPRREYFQLLGDLTRLRSRPRSAWIQSASYSARIDGIRLREGRLTFQLVNNTPAPVTVPLAPLGLAIESLQQNGKTPSWGTTASGNVVIVAPPGTSTVTGNWSLPGRKIVSLVDFDLSLAPAVQTSLVLDLPSGYRLSSSEGQISREIATLLPAVPEGHRRVRLDLGRRTHCQLVVDQAPTAAPASPTRLLLRQSSSCEISISGARIVTELVFERTGQATRELVLTMPAQVRVESILYDGAPVQARRVTSSGPQSWKITLPDPLPHAVASPSRTLQVTLEADIRPGGAWRLPQVSVSGTRPIGNPLEAPRPDLTLSVKEPLELKTFQVVGWKQTADSVGGRRFTFRQIAAITSLQLVVGQPQRSLAADVLARIDRDQSGWTASAEIAWSATSGASFSTRAVLAPGWNIVDLRPVDPAVRIEWRTIAMAGNRQQLIIEWSDAVDTTSTRPLMVRLSRAGSELDVSDLPLVEPLDCDRHRLVLAAAVPLTGTRLGEATPGRLQPIRPETLGDPWSGFASFEAVTESAAGGLFRWSPDAPPEPDQRLSPAPTPNKPTTSAPTAETAVDSDTETTETGDGNSEAGSGRAIAMRVLTRLAPIDADLDHHSAVITFSGGSFRRAFRFQLPDPARLEAVLVNGQVAGAGSDGPSVSIPPLEQGVLRSIEIRYTTPAATAFLVSGRSIPFPQLEMDVAFTWEVAAAPDQVVTATPGLLTEHGMPPNGHWSARLLGPLGRGPHHALFNPLSPWDWWQLVEGSTASAGDPSDWDRRRTSLKSAPHELPVSLVRHDRLAALGWLVLAVVLIAGGCCRLTSRRLDARWTSGGLAMLVLLSWWVPAPWTLLSGAALAACWLLLLLPVSLWRRQPLSRWPSSAEDIDEASLGSTRTYRGLPTGLGILLAVAGLSHAAAQAPPRTAPAPPRTPLAGRPDVLLPVDADGRPSSVVPFAFVRPILLESLKAERRLGDSDSGVMLRQAEYTATFGPDGSIGLKATIEAVITATDAPVRVVLPVDGVNLGPDACRVNTLRHPLARADDGKTLLLDLPPSDSDTPRVDRIELDLRPTVKTTPRGGRIDLSIPRVLTGRLQLVLPANPPRVAVPAAIAVDSMMGHFLLGAGRRLRIEWTSDPAADVTAPRPTVTVAPLCRVVVHPLESQLEYRLPVAVSGGSLSFITLALPEQLLFRPGDISAPDLLTIRSLPNQSGRQLLVVEFATPQTDDFEIRLVGRLPLTAENSRLTIQPLVTLAHGAPPVPVVAVPLRLGLNPAGGFQLTGVTPAPEGATAIDVAEFTRDWIGTGTDQPDPLDPTAPAKPSDTSDPADPSLKDPPQPTPQPLATLAWSLDRPLGIAVEVQPLRPRRVVRVEQFLHIGHERMELTITATARTTGSSVFHHSLTIDPRLKITSVSIQQQDGAERLARSARVGNRLVLYLKDANLSEEETQEGIQNITIQGELPLVVPQNVLLPKLVFDDAETTSRTLSLYHAPQLAVAVIGATPLTPTDDANSPVDARQVLAGRFALPENSEQVEFRVSRKALPAPIQLVFRLQPDPSGPWLLQARTLPLPGPRPNGPLMVRVESALLAVNGAENPLRWQPVPDSQSVEDGRIEADFQSVSGITLDAVLPDVPAADRWTPPLPLVSGRQIRQRLLVLPGQIDWVPDGDVTQLDAWPDSLVRDEFDADGLATLWRLDGPNWSLSRNIPSTSVPDPATQPEGTSTTPSRSNRANIPTTTTAANSTSPWWIAWQILISSTLAGLVAWGFPRLQRSRTKQWIRRNDSVAWLLIGLTWWLAGIAGALGFGLATVMAAVFLIRARRESQPNPKPQPTP